MPYFLGGQVYPLLPEIQYHEALVSDTSIHTIEDEAGVSLALLEGNISNSGEIISATKLTDELLEIQNEAEDLTDVHVSDVLLGCFEGPVLVIRLQGDHFEDCEELPGIKLWRVTREQIEQRLAAAGISTIPNKLFITAEQAPVNSGGYQSPKHVIVLDPEAAEWLTTNPDFNAFGTSWYGSDFELDNEDRPVLEILSEQAVVYKRLALGHVPEGQYYLSGFPWHAVGHSNQPGSKSRISFLSVLYGDGELPVI